MVVNAILDFFSVATLLPVIFLLVNPAFVQTNHFFHTLYTWSGLSTTSHFIVVLASAILIFSIGKNIVSLAIAKRKARFCFTLGSDLSSRVLSRFMEQRYSTYVTTDHSKEINRIANVPVAFANNIILPIANLLSEGLVLFALLLFVTLYQPIVVLLLAVILIPLIFYYRKRSYNINKISRDLKEKYPLTLKYALQMVEGFVEVKSSGKESFFTERFKKASRSLASTFVNDHVNQTGSLRVTEVIASLVICLLIIFSLLNNQNDTQTILLLGVYAGVSFRLIPSINRILNSITQIRSHEFLFQELNKFTLPVMKGGSTHSGGLSFTKSIELSHIYFGYSATNLIFQNISLRITKGEKIALTGKSGAGKTTLLMILLKFLNCDRGKIVIDGCDVDIADADWRKLFGYVPQIPFILDGSISENIAFGVPTNEINRQKIKQLIADLDLQELIDGMPDGVNTPIGEKGIKLSGGQRQRIAVARALYLGAEILLFDEITNQLDAETEREIFTTLTKVTWQQKTVIMITHQPHLLSFFDRILVLENGMIIEKK
jgi:ABC-type multidrug transport system fused ATPase/permease subunit